MFTKIYEVRFRHFGQAFGNFDEIREPHYASIYDQMSRIFPGKEYSLDGQKINISIDWSNLVNRELKYFSTKSCYGIQSEEMDALWADHLKPFCIAASIEAPFWTPPNDSKIFQNPFINFLKHYLSECFLIGNLAIPGALDFGSIEILSSSVEIESLSLSHYCFELAWTESLRLESSIIEAIEIDDVQSWYYSTTMPYGDLSSTSVESALISLLHTCVGLDYSQTLVIWLAHALESIYETEPGQSFGSLARRASLLLNNSWPSQLNLKKELRKFYDLRSAFVHGGFKPSHPFILNDSSETQWKQFESVQYPCDFASFTLLATLQCMIKNKWTQLKFNESVSGT